MLTADRNRQAQIRMAHAFAVDAQRDQVSALAERFLDVTERLAHLAEQAERQESRTIDYGDLSEAKASLQRQARQIEQQLEHAGHSSHSGCDHYECKARLVGDGKLRTQLESALESVRLGLGMIEELQAVRAAES